MPGKLSDYRFELPPELIAQRPIEPRDSSRMLTVDRASDAIADRAFRDLPRLLRKGDLLVMNNTQVFPARLIGQSETGARIELFLVEETAPSVWTVLAKPGRRLSPGKRVLFGERLSAEVIEGCDDGRFLVKLHASEDLSRVIDEIGRTPLPPYIKRNGVPSDLDRETYQTVYAKDRGAIAAPTAGLHFSPAVLEEIREAGVETAEITLHVGYGTFAPVRQGDLASHSVLPERYSVSEEAAAQLESARRDGRRIVAVGTTTTRTLEHLMSVHGEFRSGAGLADITILPGYRFRGVSALLTNFHLPESSLLILVAAFGGYDLIMSAYRHAVSSRYRFYSYGDCMFVE